MCWMPTVCVDHWGIQEWCVLEPAPSLLLVTYILFVSFSPFVNFVPTSPTSWLYCSFFQSRNKTYCFCIPHPSTQRVVPTPAALASPGSLLEMLVRKLSPTPGLLNWNLHFTKIPRWFLCTFKLRSTVLKQSFLMLGCTLKQMGNKDGPFRHTPGHHGCQSLKAGHHCLGGGLHHGPGCSHHLNISHLWIRCCQIWNTEWCWALVCQHKKSSGPLKGRCSCCCSETVVWRVQGRSWARRMVVTWWRKDFFRTAQRGLPRTCQWTFPVVLEISCIAWCSWRVGWFGHQDFKRQSGRVTNCLNFPRTEGVSQDSELSVRKRRISSAIQDKMITSAPVTVMDIAQDSTWQRWVVQNSATFAERESLTGRAGMEQWFCMS